MTQIEDKEGLLLVRLEGPRLDAAAAPSFKKALEAKVTGKPGRILIDANRVEFLDSTGLGVLVSLLKMMGQPGVVGIAGAQPAVRRLLQITQLDRIFRLFDDPSDAENALRSA